MLAIGPLLMAVLVLVAYPETAHRELEDLNPEDHAARPAAYGDAGGAQLASTFVLIRRRRSRVAAIASFVALLALTAACGDDNEGDDAGGPVPDSVGTGEPGDGDPDGDEIPVLDGDVPPVNAADIESLYAEDLKALGMRLTPRGGLIDRSDGGYYQSSTGDHLALYVEPIAERTDQEYVDGIVEVSRVFAADVFDAVAGSRNVRRLPGAAPRGRRSRGADPDHPDRAAPARRTTPSTGRP